MNILIKISEESAKQLGKKTCGNMHREIMLMEVKKYIQDGTNLIVLFNGFDNPTIMKDTLFVRED